jgi:hypothetical protein
MFQTGSLTTLCFQDALLAILGCKDNTLPKGGFADALKLDVTVQVLFLDLSQEIALLL